MLTLHLACSDILQCPHTLIKLTKVVRKLLVHTAGSCGYWVVCSSTLPACRKASRRPAQCGSAQYNVSPAGFSIIVFVYRNAICFLCRLATLDLPISTEARSRHHWQLWNFDFTKFAVHVNWTFFLYWVYEKPTFIRCSSYLEFGLTRFVFMGVYCHCTRRAKQN